MKKFLGNLAVVLLFAFGFSCAISTGLFNTLRDQLIMMVLGGVFLLGSFILVITLCKRGFYNE